MPPGIIELNFVLLLESSIHFNIQHTWHTYASVKNSSYTHMIFKSCSPLLEGKGCPWLMQRITIYYIHKLPMFFAWMLALQPKITSFVTEFCRRNTQIYFYCSHFKGAYFCKLIYQQNMASYMLLLLLWNYRYFSLFSGEPASLVMGYL
jgi:hypothetical protein